MNNGNSNNKKSKKYVTLKDGGYDFRSLAKIMSKSGFRMNHATARNQLILAIESLLVHICAKLKTDLPPGTIKEMVESQEIHDQLSDVLYMAYKALKEEEKKEKSYDKKEDRRKRVRQQRSLR